MDNILYEKIKDLRKDGLGIRKIAEIVKKSTETVREYLVLLNELPNIPTRGGGRKRKYVVNDLFFEKINSESNAYILGFLFADGCIHVKRNRFSITLKSDDEDILIRINELLNSNFPISHHTARYNKNSKYTNKSVLQITSKQILLDLEKTGCVSKKSDILIFPNIDNNYRHHFMRGYFDGDGSSYITSQNDIRISIISTKDFCESFLYYLPYNGKAKVAKDKRFDKNIYTITIGGQKNIKPIYEFLYKDATIFLERKKIVFDKYYQERESI